MPAGWAVVPRKVELFSIWKWAFSLQKHPFCSQAPDTEMLWTSLGMLLHNTPYFDAKVACFGRQQIHANACWQGTFTAQTKKSSLGKRQG